MLIVHGYTASPASNWFPWLAQALREEGARVDVPSMPDPQAPDPQTWARCLRDLLPSADAGTFLVGHSLGCIALLRHVLSLPVQTRVGGALLVSGFDRALPTLPELAAFTAQPLDHAELVRRLLRRTSLLSDNDGIVAPEASRDLAAALDSELEQIPGGGHFLDREGFTRFPQAYQALMRWMQVAR